MLRSLVWVVRGMDGEVNDGDGGGSGFRGYWVLVMGMSIVVKMPGGGSKDR